MRLVRGSSRYAIGALPRNTTPCRFGLTILLLGPPASPVPGVSDRVGLKRLRLAIILYACAGGGWGWGGGGAGGAGGGGGAPAAPAPGGREGGPPGGGAETSCFTISPTQRSEMPASTT